MDIFTGSGTTSKVAHELSRNSIGIEINEDYLPLIKRKVEFDKNGNQFEIVKANGHERYAFDEISSQIEIISERIKGCFDCLNNSNNSPVITNWEKELDSFFRF